MDKAIGFVKQAVGCAWAYVRADAQAFCLIVAIFAGLSIATDLLASATVAPFLNAVLGMLLGYLQLLVTFRMLHMRGAAPLGYTLADRTEGRFPSVIALSFLGGAGILFGLLLLAVPGLILAMLWSVAMPALAAERLGASEAMARSWRLVRPALGRIALLGTAVTGIFAAFAVLTAGAIHVAPAFATLLIVLTETASSAVLLFNAAIWTAAYLDLRDGAPYPA